MPTLFDRFHKGYLKVPSGCWVWQRSKDKDGYGYIKEGKTKKAHRVSWTLHNGEIPDNLWVLHRCDNPSCVNPDHLFLGSSQDNNDDMVAKGRAKYPGADNRGNKNPNRKISQEDVDWMRANYKRGLGPVFSKKFGIGKEMVNRIIRGEAWRTS